MTTTKAPTPGFLAWRLAMKWRAAVDRAVAPLGLTHAQYSLMASLRGMAHAGYAAPSQRELAEFTGLEPLYVSKLARALEGDGLVERTVHPHDTRAVQLVLTKRGVETIDQAVVVVRDLLEQLTEPLGGLSGRRTAAFVRDVQALLAVPSPSDPSESSEP